MVAALTPLWLCCMNFLNHGGCFNPFVAVLYEFYKALWLLVCLLIVFTPFASMLGIWIFMYINVHVHVRTQFTYILYSYPDLVRIPFRFWHLYIHNISFLLKIFFNFLYMYMYLQLHVHTFTCTCIHTCIPTVTYMYMYFYTYIHTCTYMYIHVDTVTYMYKYTCTFYRSPVPDILIILT